MTNKFFAGLIAAAAAFLPPPALASEPFLQNHPEHYELFQTLERTGIEMYINDLVWCEEAEYGFYGWNGDAGYAVLIICQTNGEPGGSEVEWTPEDLDTLRHEAHHVVQDCMVGTFGDGRFSLLFDTEEKLAKFLMLSNATKQNILDIFEAYSDRRVDERWREVEALFVARGVDASSIANGVRNKCRN